MEDHSTAKEHLMAHVTYPASKEQLVQACNESEYSQSEKDEFATKLPEGTYNTAEEVNAAMGW